MPPGQPAAPNDPRTPRPPTGLKRWRPSWVTAAILVAAVALGAIGYVKWGETHPHLPKFCEGVGLGGPPASSRQAAFDAWRASYGFPQPPSASWRLQGNTFINTSYTVDRRHGFQSVQVERGGPLSLPRPLPPTVWTVQGGCV